MSDLFNSVRADLLDRRMRPLLALAVVAVVAAFAYALLGGGGGSPTPSPETLPLGAGSAPGGISVSASAANANRAVAEVSGSPAQRRGSTRNPFAPLPGSSTTAKTTPATATATSPAAPTAVTGSAVPSSGAEPSTTPSNGGGGTSSGGAAPAAPKKKPPATKKKAAPEKAESKYRVDILFGPLPAGTPVQNAQLTPYKVLTIWQKFPSEQDRMLSFVRVTSEPRKAKFNIIGDVIPRGQADCLPRPSKCEAIALGPGQSEELERRSQTGQPEVFGLQVVSIRPRSHDRTDRAKSARLALEHESRG